MKASQLEVNKNINNTQRNKLSWDLFHRSGLPQEISLFCFTEVTDSDMRKHLFLKDFLGVFDSFLFCDTRSRSTCTDEIECNILFLNDERLIQRWFYLNDIESLVTVE